MSGSHRSKPRATAPPWFAALLRIGLLAAVLGSGLGCKSLRVQGEPYVNRKAPAGNTVQTIAVLPVKQTVGRPDLVQPLRDALFSATAILPFRDRELHTVDAELARIASEREISPASLSDAEMCDPRVADCVIYTRLAKIDRLYLFLFVRRRIELDMTLVDTRTRGVIYRNRFRISDRRFSISLTPLGLVERAAEGLWVLRQGYLDELLSEAIREIAAQLPELASPLARSGGLELKAVQVETGGREVLALGDTLQVYAGGTPGMRCSFSIGRVIGPVELEEIDPGRYLANYTIREGDHLPYAVVSVALEDPTTDARLEFVAAPRSFAIDTRAPTPPRVARWWPNKRGRGIYLELEFGTNGATPGRIEYQVMRRRVGESQAAFHPIGETSEPIWHDSTALPGQAYEYGIRARDDVGNLSEFGPITRIDPR